MTKYYGLGHGGDHGGATFGRYDDYAVERVMRMTRDEILGRAFLNRVSDERLRRELAELRNDRWIALTKRGYQFSRRAMRYPSSMIGSTIGMPILTDAAGQALLGQFWSIVNGPGPGWTMVYYCRGGGVLVGTGGGDCTPGHLSTQNGWDAALGKLVGGDQAWYNIETARYGSWQLNYDVGERWRWDAPGYPDPETVPKALPLHVLQTSSQAETWADVKPKKMGQKHRVFFPLGDSSWRSYTGAETATSFNREPPGDGRGNRVKWKPWPRKPKPREREVKPGIGGRLGHQINAAKNLLVGAVTESMDAVNAVWKAVSPAGRRQAFEENGYKPLNVAEKAAYILGHFWQVDFEGAVVNLINNQIEDFVYGFLGQLDQKAAKSRGAGSTTMYRIEKSLRDMGIEGFSSGEDDPRKKLIEFLQIER